MLDMDKGLTGKARLCADSATTHGLQELLGLAVTGTASSLRRLHGDVVGGLGK